MGVSDKSISKWEVGKAMPSIDNLLRLRQLWGVSIDEMIQEKQSKKQVSFIVLTGGPCAGKSTAASQIESQFSKMGYKVLFIPETATELIQAGITPWEMNTNLEYQMGQFKLQLAKEETFLQAAQCLPDDKVLIVCDRGLMDNCAYMTEAEMQVLLQRLGMSVVKARDRYDAVFHLVTAAKNAEEFYTTENNSARRETPEEAVALDDKLIAAWTGHPHLRIIDNSTDFEEKMHRLMKEISTFLGEPEPYEIERKFLIRRPTDKQLASLQNCERVDILQTYLTSSDGAERRLRQRGSQGSYLYTLTEKRLVTSVKRVETEKRISRKEYLTLLMNADPTRAPIRKQRYCLIHDNQYIEIDIYPFWDDKAIVEVELNDENEEIHLPDYLNVLREVTDDERFKNHALALSHDVD